MLYSLFVYCKNITFISTTIWAGVNPF